MIFLCSHRLVVVSIMFTFAIVQVFACGTLLPHQYYTCPPFTIRQQCPSRSRRSALYSSQGYVSTNSFVMRRRNGEAQNGSENVEASEVMGEEPSDLADFSYDDLGPIGKTVAGCTEIVVSTALEYVTGYLQGFFFGTLVGAPGFLFRPIEKGVRQPFATEVSSRFARMNTRSTSWGKNFGAISAAFGGFGVAVRVIRNGQEDAWNQIISSAAAGAFFERKNGPQAMLRGAMLYGGLIYATSGGIRQKPSVTTYTEQPALEF